MGPARIKPYHAGMSEVDSPEDEAEALDQLKAAFRNRDSVMLRRGTYRGIAIAMGILFAFWAVKAGTLFEMRFAFGPLALFCFYLVWRLGRIPLEGREQVRSEVDSLLDSLEAAANEALDQWEAARRKLEQEGVDGGSIFMQTVPQYEKFDAFRKKGEFVSSVINRNAGMLRRGTRRGIAIGLGLLFSVWTVRSFSLSNVPVEGQIVLGVLALSCLYYAWRSGRIPYLGEEDEIDQGGP